LEFNDRKVEVETVILEKLRFALSQEILASSLSVEVSADHIVSDMVEVIRIKFALPAERLPEQELVVLIAEPDSWWQMFKRDVLPACIGRRWPVRTGLVPRHIRVIPKAVYPRLPMFWPEGANKMTLQFLDAEEIWWDPACKNSSGV
jgi:hypothetical protein